jgi:hypothetical protein
MGDEVCRIRNERTEKAQRQSRITQKTLTVISRACTDAPACGGVGSSEHSGVIWYAEEREE